MMFSDGGSIHMEINVYMHICVHIQGYMEAAAMSVLLLNFK